jgi:putative ABC transport system ATP-binding protein
MDSHNRNTPEDPPLPHAVSLRSVTKSYGSSRAAVTALDDISMTLQRGAFTAVMGRSGSGKSTLMHCAAGLDRPTSGQVVLGDLDLTALSEHRLTLVRRERIGFVFQAFNLVPALTAWENILLPLRLGGRRPDREWAREVVERVGLGDRLSHRPSELSGGQQQRVAIARALVSRPQVVFADEPTGALDLRTGQEIMQLLRDAVNGVRQTVVMVSHDPAAAAWADRVVFLADGRVAGEIGHATAEQVAERLTWLSAPELRAAASA